MSNIDHNTVHSLKGEGLYFAAGALAFELHMPCAYGCHFGMRSTVDYARSQFRKGWLAAEQGAR